MTEKILRVCARCPCGKKVIEQLKVLAPDILISHTLCRKCAAKLYKLKIEEIPDDQRTISKV